MRSGRQQGFAWVFVLAALALASAAGALVAQRWSDRTTREREQMLLRIGDDYARALSDYHATSPGSDKRYPATLEQLVMDTRFVGIRRHIRKLYADPMTGQPDWVLLRDPRGDIIGVHSRSELQPWTRVPQHLPHVDLPAAERYAGWAFTPRVPL